MTPGSSKLGAWCASVIPALFGPSIALAAASPPQPAMVTLSSTCLSTLKSPKVITTSPAVLPDDIWDSRPVLKALVSFRIDEVGVPTSVLATVTGLDADGKSTFERDLVEVFKRYRFCPRGDFSTTVNWTAQLLFSPIAREAEPQGIAVYVQSFVPNYVGLERFGHHSGRNVVRGVYGADGRPRSVEIVTSSGDRVLDDKSLDAMASAQLVFRNGATPTAPIHLERPFVYRQ
jgi:TonB family protein